MEEIVLIAYIAALSVLFVFGSHGFIMIYYYLKFKNRDQQPTGNLDQYPVVTVQLPSPCSWAIINWC